MDYETRLFNKIARSHMYWGRKPIAGVRDALGDLGPGQVLFDPFCGGGSAAIVALRNGARVIASDLNPMAVFLTQVLLRPINLRNLRAAFDFVRDHVAEEILTEYSIKCPTCRGNAVIEDIIWQRNYRIEAPVEAKILCKKCDIKDHKALCEDEAKAQVSREIAKTQYWYPRTRIRAYRKPLVKYHYQLFSGRNLRSLAELLNTISKIEDVHCRDALKYVFTAMLYSCSKMQMYTKTNPRSSRGWYACRYYLPPMWKEKNVWLTFEDRFRTFLASKDCLNRLLPHIRVTTDPNKFLSENIDALVLLRDAFNPLRSLSQLVTHVFLDPPYNDDIEYFAFSELWGSWLKMNFDYKHEWKARELKAEGLQKILSVIHENTREDCSIALAFEPKEEAKWRENECIIKSGYCCEKIVPFFYNNSNKRGFKKKDFRKKDFIKKKDRSKTKGRLLILRKSTKEMDIKSPQYINHSGTPKKATAYLRAAACLFDVKSPEAIHEHTATIIPDHLHEQLRNIKDKYIAIQTKLKHNNERSYISLCLSLLNNILQLDGWRFEYINTSFFDEVLCSCILDRTVQSNDITHKSDIPAIAVKGGKRILFFFDMQTKYFLKTISHKIADKDSNKYETICVLITRSIDKMNELRKEENAKDWRRGFFIAFDELWNKYDKLANNDSLRLIASYSTMHKYHRDRNIEGSISTFEAKIIDKIQVGGPTSSYHKIRFQAPELERISPGQFVMIDTRTKHHKIWKPPIALNKLKASIDLNSKAYLKRPFGIHRAFYEGFKPDYLKYFSLPPHIATVMHTVRPNKYDILFKVLENGIGTNELRELKPNDQIQMIGPLGKRFSVRELRDLEFEEVHVIGGGVGMAPLIFLVQALKFYAFRVKAFVGIESLEILKYRDPLYTSFKADSSDAKIYWDDLQDAGIDKSDIFISSDTKSSYEQYGIINYHHGLVSEQYETFLKENRVANKVIAFTCGPLPMMQKIRDITCNHQIPLKVLMEKRMACGIGVCLSCVCSTRKNGNEKYVSVCTEGPVFDASEIVW